MRIAAISFGLLMLLQGPLNAQTHSDLEKQLAETTKHLSELDAKAKGRIDAEVGVKAVEWILRHNEFFKKEFYQYSADVLKLTNARIDAIAAGTPDWGNKPGRTVLAYRSEVDGSVQPYAVTLPEGFDANSKKRWPLYVVLHGRNGTLNEVRFFNMHEGKPAKPDDQWIQIDVFGRVNNAFRWAGETDVFEAMNDVQKRYKINTSRVTLWGFSMGGAGAWHLGLHHPSRWASAGAGAGFVDFYRYQKKKEHLPAYQHRALSIYDAVDYSQNLTAVPFITYGGEKDTQLLASLIIQERAKELGVPLELLIGPNMGHKFDPESQKKFNAFLLKHNEVGRKRVPGLREFSFETHTLKYNRIEWLTILEQDEPYARSTVNSKQNDRGEIELTTEHINALSIARTPADRILIDGSGPFNMHDAGDGNLPDVYFVKGNNGWELLDYDDSLSFIDNPDLNKRHDLQGPIDDAFMSSFRCVLPTGTPTSPELNEYASWSYQRFARDFDKWMRAEIRTVNDVDLTEEQIKSDHLVLFGDPSSNAVIKKIVDQLPIKWNDSTLTFNGKTYSTKDHAIVMVYPNPLNSKRYVVINSGMTMREKDFKSSNSFLFAKWGDHAIIQFAKQKDGTYTEKVINAGIFDAHWQIEK